MARKAPEINSSSMADIAFLLLIFFLVTTTMNVDSGILRKLPPPLPDEVEKPPPIKERNVFQVLLNRNNDLLVEGEVISVDKLREKTKEFISNPLNEENLSESQTLSEKLEKAEAKGEAKKVKEYQLAIKELGDRSVSKGVVSLQNDRGTEYQAYIRVQNELVAAFNELKDALAKEVYGEKFDDLSEDKQDLIQLVYPLSISEAEPKHVGGKE